MLHVHCGMHDYILITPVSTCVYTYITLDFKYTLIEQSELYFAYSAMHVCRDCLHIFCKPHCKSSLPCYKLQMPWLIRV